MNVRRATNLFTTSTLCALGALNCASIAGDCEPHWETVIGQPGVSSAVHSLALFDEGDGPRIFAGGFFSDAGGQPVGRIARWDGATWSAVGGGLGFGGDVFALLVWDDGTGPALYAGGHFLEAGGQPVNRIAKWDGQNWSPLGEGVGGQIIDMAAFDGSLYVVGDFQTAGGQPATYIARWDGSSWSSVAGGLNNIATGAVVHDDGTPGSGPALYVSGVFTEAGGAAALRIARWDGSSWSAVGGGAGGFVATVRSLDLGDGPALYAGGGFTTIGGISANRIAKWDGSSWSALGAGVNNFVRDIVAFDNGTPGSGPAVYAGGQFTIAGSVSANRIARWDGAEWSPLNLGLEGTGSPGAWALLVAGGLTADEVGLYVGGSFATAGGQSASNIATWRGCLIDDPAPKCPADLTGDGSVGVADLLVLLSCWGPVAPGSECEAADLTESGSVGVSDLLELLSQWGPCPR